MSGAPPTRIVSRGWRLIPHTASVGFTITVILVYLWNQFIWGLGWYSPFGFALSLILWASLESFVIVLTIRWVELSRDGVRFGFPIRSVQVLWADLNPPDHPPKYGHVAMIAKPGTKGVAGGFLLTPDQTRAILTYPSGRP